MGLREAAESARIRQQEATSEKRRQEEERRRQQEMQRRDAIEAHATDTADEWGFEIAEYVWVQPPVTPGYTKLPVLIVRSDDGVWLEFSQYKPNPSAMIKPRFSVVDKCPSCEAWIGRGSHASSLALLGDQLAKPSRVPQHHLQAHGTEVSC